MELISEVYDILRSALGMSAPEIGKIFAAWNQAELDSYLIEITAAVLGHIDPETGQPMVDVIVDKAGTEGHRKVDFAERARPRRRHPDDQRRAGRAHSLGAQRGAHRRLEGPPGAGREVRGRPGSVHRDAARGLAPGHRDLLRAGVRADAGGFEGIRLRPALRRDRPHLEGRLHHPRQAAGPDQAGLRR